MIYRLSKAKVITGIPMVEFVRRAIDVALKELKI